MEAIIVQSPTILSRQTEKQRRRNEGRIYRESEVLTEKSSGTGKSKTNPFHNLPL